MDYVTFGVVVVIESHIPPKIRKQTSAFLEVFMRLPPGQSKTVKRNYSGHHSRIFGGGIIRPLQGKGGQRQRFV